MKTACYDLEKRPASFDFVQFLVTAKTLGYDHVRVGFNGVYCHKDFKDYATRHESIIRQAPALLEMDWSEGALEGDQEVSHAIGGPLAAYKQKGFVAKYKSVLPPKTGDYITVTLRNSRKEKKNSNEAAWLEFAEKVKAVVIPDYVKQPIHLHERMSLYAGAKMNFLVANGPASLLYFSDYPYCVLKMRGAMPDFHFKEQGLLDGFQWPFANEKQRIYWDKDTPEMIWKAYEETC